MNTHKMQRMRGVRMKGGLKENDLGKNNLEVDPNPTPAFCVLYALLRFPRRRRFEGGLCNSFFFPQAHKRKTDGNKKKRGGECLKVECSSQQEKWKPEDCASTRPYNPSTLGLPRVAKTAPLTNMLNVVGVQISKKKNLIIIKGVQTFLLFLKKKKREIQKKMWLDKACSLCTFSTLCDDKHATYFSSCVNRNAPRKKKTLINFPHNKKEDCERAMKRQKEET